MKGSGELKKAERVSNERISALAENLDVHLAELAKLLLRTETAPVGLDGYVAYTKTYAKCKDG